MGLSVKKSSLFLVNRSLNARANSKSIDQQCSFAGRAIVVKKQIYAVFNSLKGNQK